MTTRTRGGVALPRVFVSVTGCAGRWTAGVDSCSSRSLLAKETAEMLGVAVRPVADEAGPLTAIDGTTVQVLGTANLTISRDDVNFHGPEVSAEFQVVKSLEVVAADLLIGIDIVSSLGGVYLVYDEASGGLTKVTFGPKPQNPAAVGALAEPENTGQKMPGHVSVAQEDGRVTLTMSDGEAVFDKANRFWTLRWKWADGEAPTLSLHKYRVRPHSMTKISPAEAICGWEPRGLLLETNRQELSDSAWVDRLRRHAARIHDNIEEELSALYFEDDTEAQCPYSVGTRVLLRRPDRAQKRQPPYECGWEVSCDHCTFYCEDWHSRWQNKDSQH